MKGVSVVIPAYNEEGAIAAVVKEAAEVLGKAEFAYEIIVVNDGSTDNTAALAQQNGARVITNPHNVGYGAALKIGILNAQYDYVAMIDGDGSYPVGEIPRMIGYLEQGFDLVVGKRTGIYYLGSIFKQPARYVFRWLSEFVAGTRIPDVNSGMRAFRHDAIADLLRHTSSGFSFTTSMTVVAILEKKFVKHYPVEYYRRVGKSKVRMFRDTLRAGQVLVETIARYNPVKLFLLLSLPLFLLALLLALLFVVLGEPILILSTVVSLLGGILVFTMGLVVVAIVKR